MMNCVCVTSLNNCLLINEHNENLDFWSSDLNFSDCKIRTPEIKVFIRFD